MFLESEENMNKIHLIISSNKPYFKYLWKNAKAVVILDMFFLFSSIVFSLIEMYAPKFFIDEITINKSLTKAMSWIILLVVSQVYIYIRSQLFFKWKQKYKLEAEFVSIKDAYNKFGTAYISFFEDDNKMDIFHRGIRYAENGGHATYALLLNALSVLISSFVLAFVSFQFGWWVWIAFLIAFFAKLLISKKCERIQYSFDRAHTLMNRRVQYFTDVLKDKSTFQEGRVYDSIDFFIQKMIDERRTKFKDEKDNSIRQLKLNGISLGINKCIDVMCYAVIGYAMLHKGLTLGDYALFFATCSRINKLLDAIKATLIMYFQESNNVENYKEFLAECESISCAKVDDNDIIHLNNIYRIEFDNVYFRYKNQTIPAIKDASISINRGERISVVGLNGAGKTTFIKLLLGLYKPESGNIYVNECNLKDIHMKDYWRHVSVVYQDYKIYPLTILDNILFGIRQPEDNIKSALVKAQLFDKIQSMENGSESKIYQSYYKEGIDLSGGEKQRIAIARAIVKNSDLYIFDEPSSALDAIAEEQLYQIINSIPNDKTVIFISHRLASVSSTNRVIMFENGEIIGDGNHDQLIKQCPQYRSLYETQSRRYG